MKKSLFKQTTTKSAGNFHKICTGACTAILMLSMLTACSDADNNNISDSSNNSDSYNAEILRDIDIYLDAYDTAGAVLLTTEPIVDENGIDTTAESEYGTICFLGAEGETFGEALTACDYLKVTPQLDGDTFEGWMEYQVVTTVDDDGFEETTYSLITDKIYSNEELLNLTVPDHSVMYIAKWSSIPAEDYFATNPWDDADSDGSFSLIAEGGTISFHESSGNEYDLPFYTYWLDDGQTLNDIMGGEFYATIGDVHKDGAEFAGWTLYVADAAFWNDTPADQEGYTSFLYSEESAPDADFYSELLYLIMPEPMIQCKTITTEELCDVTCSDGQCYLAIANWK